jgi:hypothetical protein
VRLRLEDRWLRESWKRHKELVDQLELGDEQRAVLEVRWFEEAKHYDEVWRRRRLAYLVFGCLTIVASLSVPLLAGLDAAKWSLAAAGFVAALAGALEGFFNFGERWRQQRLTAVLIKDEGLRFIELRPPYEDLTHREAFPLFTDRLERLNQAQSQAYLAVVGQDPRDLTYRDPESGG